MDLISTLKKDLTVAWDVVQQDVRWLTTETGHVIQMVEKADPAIQATFAQIITDGEAGAVAVAQYEGQALSGELAGALPTLEELVASLVANSLGATPGALIASKGSAQVVADIGGALEQLSKVALAKVVAGIASEANTAQAAIKPQA